ncbi:hypothetical protein PLESTB_000473800 [Pleodorina starrii]|uniref:DNA-directed DNA polymerase n=1 Tax=Pleodorina starrii TaxID=330485 RepID=A0A9W6BGF5_9CHLO|nr:hypothetical protein PLESTB_000473800 [Pleodorina starrii]
MSGYGRGRGRLTSLQAFDANDPAGGGRYGGRGGGRGRGRGRRPLNPNLNYMPRGGEGGPGGSEDDSSHKLAQVRAEDALDEQLGFPLFTTGDDRLGWLMNIQSSHMADKDSGHVVASVDCYFMCQDGTMFKARLAFSPYFYVRVREGREVEAENYLRRKCEGAIRSVEVVEKEDLDLKNHLSGIRRRLLRVRTFTVQQLMDVRREVAPLVAANAAKAATTSAYSLEGQMQGGGLGGGGGGGFGGDYGYGGGLGEHEGGGAAAAAGGGAPGGKMKDIREAFLELREYDVPYHVRFAIDTDVRVGHWYTVRCHEGLTSLERRADLLQRAEPRICAFDIETTKLPLQFPNAEYDQVFMISYMLDRQGYLIVNREVVGADISDFEYTPKPEFEGPFKVTNTPDERSLLMAFFDHMRAVQPAIYVTYNGDFFDFPFIEARCARLGLDMQQLIGFRCKGGGAGGGGGGGGGGGPGASKECLSRHAVHMDCMHWVDRDSYLPQGSRGLKAVTKAKLGYDPVEVAPEDMVRLARETPQAMASYSVSDAVSTYYLYMTYVHPFIFSLATIIPLPPDEVLRKGSGTLCEQLLMVEAYRANIVCPNKHVGDREALYRGHLLESETYIGGKVEALESGVFRSDLPLKFKCSAAAYQMLLDQLDQDLTFSLRHEAKWKGGSDECVNYGEVRADIAAKLEALRDEPNREESPLIYHLDVAAMYPNIILTNRLQPSAIVREEDCAACDFNAPNKTCLRHMEWEWRGEHYSATRSEYMQIKAQLAAETFPPAAGAAGGGGGGGGAFGGGGGDGGAAAAAPNRSWGELSSDEQRKMLQERLKKYCQKVYKRVLDKPITEKRVAGICQRENSFYIDTVRAFRDRRYEYKGLGKVWKGKLDEAKAGGNPIRIQEATDMCVLYESLQLAHKCILNSFYGYVMRKGARWYSMEMAGVVTYTGARIIERANKLVLQLGRTLELDTDGIWCALPGTFPENFKFKNKNGKEFKLSYPCCVLNAMVATHNTNDQYQTLVRPAPGEEPRPGPPRYVTSSEMSIEFEVDGPYRAMILPASKEEGKSIKKRYAVFNHDGSLAELKGFEVKRRGELKLIKVFQAEVFEQFLAGVSLEECYCAVAAVANRWLDLLDTRGADLNDEELLEHISEATTMSKALAEYEGRKSCAISTANRLAAFLGDERIKDKGLNCTYVIAKQPASMPTSERAIPVSIFSAEPAVARAWLRRWCGGDVGSGGQHGVPDVRDIVDWDYYRERLGSAIQKIITIPAALQGLTNPVPRVKHPDWLHKKIRERTDKCQQLRLDHLLARMRDKVAKEQQQQQDEEDAAMVDADVVSPGGDMGDLEDLFEGAGPGGAAKKAQAAAAKVLSGAAAAGGSGSGGGGGGGPREVVARARAVAAAGAGRRRQQRDGEGDGEGAGEEAGVAGGEAGVEVAVEPEGEGRGKENSPGAANKAGAPAAAAAPVSLSSDYGGWVAAQKPRWRSIRLENKRRKAEAAKAAEAARRAAGGGGGAAAAAAAAAAAGGGGALSMRSLLANQAAALTAVPWQLVHLAETATPGQVKMWFLAGGKLHSVSLQLPRSLLVDSVLGEPNQLADSLTTAAAGGGGGGGGGGAAVSQLQQQVEVVRAQSVTLPAGRKPAYLYRVTLPEPLYRSAATRLAAALSAGHVRGVYEDRLPVALPAVLALGCCVSVAQEARGRPIGGTWRLQDFKMRTTGEVGYLDRDTSDPAQASAPSPPSALLPLGGIRHVVLYSSLDPGSGRGVFAMTLPAAERGVVVVLQPSAAAAKEVTGVLLERLWRDARAAAEQEGGPPEPERLSWEVSYERDALDASRALQRALLSYRSSVRCPTLVVVQGPMPAARLQRDMTVLHDFPSLDMPCHADDSRYPPLQWQQRAVRRALHRCAGVGLWLAERAALCRYAHAPLANLEPAGGAAGGGGGGGGGGAAGGGGGGGEGAGGGIGCVADLLMARRLREAGMTLPVVDPALPDLGGSETTEGDPREDAGAAEAVSAATRPRSELSYPGVYRSVCVTLRLHHLAVAAVEAADALAELEGAASVAGGGSGGGGGGGGGHGAAGFRVLRALQAAWIRDATVNRNMIADSLLQNLYRWLSNPSSPLHDPGLHRALLQLQHKLFLQLCSEMRRLGAVIVAANTNSITLCTGKRSVRAAAGYTRFLLEALRGREMYRWLELTPAAWYLSYMYRDPYNWAGLESEAAGAEWRAMDEQTGAGQEGEEGGPAADDEPVVKFVWNLKDNLPPAVQQDLVLLLTEFLYLPWKEARKAAGGAAGAGAAGADGGSQGGAPLSQGGSTQAAVAATRAEEVQSSFLKALVSEVFTERLLRRVGAWKGITPGCAPEWEFPQLAGSYLTKAELGHPALAFVRVATHLLSLDGRVSEQVALLRRQLLKLLHVSEFGSDAEFREMCTPFVMPDVICGFCNDCRDLDLTRDEALAQHDWRCRSCRQPLDTASLERCLVAGLRSEAAAYQTQDLACVKCKQVTSGHLRSLCGLCGGGLTNTRRPEGAARRLTVYRNLARFHGFGVLAEMAGWLLGEEAAAAEGGGEGR